MFRAFSPNRQMVSIAILRTAPVDLVLLVLLLCAFVPLRLGVNSYCTVTD
jgi:hypothetical protein